jgi:RNA polymerase sigma-70 factor (ECF subfamily)
MIADSNFAADLVALTPLLRNSARRLSRDEESAADLVQDALTKAWQARRSFAEGTNLAAWALTILRNHFRSEARRSWRQAPWDEDAATCIAAPGAAQVHALELSDTASAIDGLSETQRDALILIGVGGFSNEEAAALRGCRPAAMKNRVWRARQSLTAMLDGKEPFPRAASRARKGATDTLLGELDRLAARTAPLAGRRASRSASTAAAAML